MNNYIFKGRPKISVIVPVYNVSAYLNQCVDSILSQTYRNLEIILVDDGSTDGSGVICDAYVKKDCRVKAIHKTNAGSAFARESGLHEMTGKYVMFVDSDDWIDVKTISTCVQAIDKYPNVDLVLFSYVKEYCEHSVEMHLFDKSVYMKGRGLRHKVYRRLFGLTSKELTHPERMETMASCCMKLYTAECVTNARHFDIKSIGSAEDALFNMYALHGIKEAVYINRCFYHYRKRENTQSAAYRPNLQKQWKKLFSIMEEIITEKQLDNTYREALSNRIALSIVAIAVNELSNEEGSIYSKLTKIRQYLTDREYQKHCRNISVGDMPFAWRVFMICAKLRLTIPVYIMTSLITIIRKMKI